MNATRNGKHPTTHFGRPTRVVAFDYYDGPQEGVVQFDESDRTYLFKNCEAEPGQFELALLPENSIDRIVELLAPYFAPRWPIWAPIWQFPSPEIESAVSASVDELLAECGEVTMRGAIDFTDTLEAELAHAT